MLSRVIGRDSRCFYTAVFPLYNNLLHAQSVLAEQQRKEAEAEDRKRRKIDQLRKSREASETKRASSPLPPAGRANSQTQTVEVLEVLTDRMVESEAGTQTETVHDRPSSPLFVPAPSGVDAATQIEGDELFDFDYEVAPILEALVGRALEQGLLEVVQEEERTAIAVAQAEFEAVRDVELAAALKLEAELARRAQERADRLEQERARAAEAEAVAAKIAAVMMSRRLIAALKQSVSTQLESIGFFYDPVRRDVATLVMPAILAEVEVITRTRESARGLLDTVLAAAIARGGALYDAHVAAEAEARRLVQAAADAKAAEALAAAAAVAAAAATAEAAAQAAAAAASISDEAPADGGEGDGDDGAA